MSMARRQSRSLWTTVLRRAGAVWPRGLAAAAVMWTVAACGGGGQRGAGPSQSTARDSSPQARPNVDAAAVDTNGVDTRAVQGMGSSIARGRVLFLGTSLTAGYGLDPDQAYPALIQASIDSAG